MGKAGSGERSGGSQEWGDAEEVRVIRIGFGDRRDGWRVWQRGVGRFVQPSVEVQMACRFK